MLRSLTVTHTSLKMYPHLSELHAHLTLMDVMKSFDAVGS